jgi:alpha-tubulin suppressor-like RCC1 family protein
MVDTSGVRYIRRVRLLVAAGKSSAGPVSKRVSAQILAAALALALVATILVTFISSDTASANNVVTTQISAGSTTTCAIRTGGAAYCWGDNTYGQIGDGTTTAHSAPTPVSGDYDWAQIATQEDANAPTATTCGITTAGAGYCWGANTYGQVGDGTTSQRTVPTLISGGHTWASIAVGWMDVCGITTSRAAYCWGDNLVGENGNGTFTQNTSPVAVSGGLLWSSLSVGFSTTCGVTTSNVGYCWGSDSNGQIGDNSTTGESNPTAVGGGLSWSQIATGQNNSCGFTTSGAGYCWGYNGFGELGINSLTDAHTPTLVNGGYTWAQMSVGGFTSCGVTTAGAGYCWGDSAYGQLGNGGTTLSKVPAVISGNLVFSSISAGANATNQEDTNCGLTTGGIAYCWGYNSVGQVGDRTTTQRTIPYAVIWVNVNTASTIAPGGLSNCAVRNGGVAYCWGNNSYGQLGNGSTLTASVPTRVAGSYLWASISSQTSEIDGHGYSCGITTSGAAYCWGSNDAGQLGNGTTTASLVPAAVSGGHTWQSISVSDETTCGLTTNQIIYCWGDNSLGQLGINSSSPVQSTTPVTLGGGFASTTWFNVSVRYRTVCGVTTSGTGYCWGNNDSGEIGNGNTTTQYAPTLVSGSHTWASITASDQSVTCGVTTAGAGYCWGGNPNGQLGNGGTTEQHTPVLVSGGYTWSYISTGGSTTCGLTTAGKAYCWGYGVAGENGNGLNGASGNSTTPSAVSGSLVFQTIATGMDTTDDTNCGLTTGGAEYCWGYNSSYQVGEQTTLDRDFPTAVIWPTANTVSSIAPGGQTNCSIRNQSAYCWGKNNFGQIGDGTTTNRTSPTLVLGGYQWASISSAYESAGNTVATTCGITTSGAGYCWGGNTYGEVGDGTTTQRTSPTPISGGYTWAQISVGPDDVCGVTIAGVGYCWGSNLNGEVGNSTTTQANSPALVSGGYTWRAITEGAGNTCGVTTSNVGYCWGIGAEGELGYSASGTSDKHIPTLVYGGYTWATVVAGDSDSCGVTTAGVGYCWGFNGSGEVGNNSTTEVNIPTAVNGGHVWAQIAPGNQTTCGITTDGVGYCWGWDAAGEVGNNTSGSTPQKTPALVNGSLTFSAIASSMDFTDDTHCGINSDGSEYCWGYNNIDQVGDGTTTNRKVPTQVVWGSDAAPNNPSSLAQYQSDGTTSLAIGGTLSSATVVLGGSVSDPDVGDNDSLCVEVIPTANTFTNSPTACSSPVSTGNAVKVTIGGLNGGSYKWQAQTVDASGSTSSWATFNSGATAFSYNSDTTPPTTGSVYDGSTPGVEAAMNSGSLSSLSCNWSGFSDTGSGLASYDYSFGTTAGATDVVTWTNVSTSTTSATVNSLTLNTGQLYFCNVRAYDNASNVSSAVSSSGQVVAPTLTLSISSTSLTLSDLYAGDPTGSTANFNISASTDGYHGYLISAYEKQLLTAGSHTLADYPSATPTAWSGTGFGFNVNGGASCNCFSGSKYEHFGSVGSPTTPISHTGTVSGSPITGESETVTLKAVAPSNQPVGLYTTKLVWSAVVTY